MELRDAAAPAAKPIPPHYLPPAAHVVAADLELDFQLFQKVKDEVEMRGEALPLGTYAYTLSRTAAKHCYVPHCIGAIERFLRQYLYLCTRKSIVTQVK